MRALACFCALGGATLAVLPAEAGPFHELREADLVLDLFEDEDDCSEPSLYDAGDLNGDGFADVVLGCYRSESSGHILVLHGGPDDLTAVFEASTYAGLPAGGGDIDGDGFDDLILALNDRPRVYVGSEDGIDAQRYLPLPRPHGLDFEQPWAVAGDIDGDGFDDVVVAEAGQNGGFLVYAGSPEGPVYDSSHAYSSSDVFAAAGDLNGDGFDDLARLDSCTVGLFLGSAAGLSESLAGYLPSGASGGEQCLVGLGADIDGDGWLDAVAAGYPMDRAWVYLNDGGEFIEAGLSEIPGSAVEFGAALSMGDLDGDGYAELVVGAPGAGAGRGEEGPPGQLWVYPGGPLGAGSLVPTTLRGEPGTRLGLAVLLAGDIDGDGARDLVAAGEDERLRIWYGGGDLDGDGYGWASDCDEGDAAVNPAAAETCNGVDDDCDGWADEGCPLPGADEAGLGLRGGGVVGWLVFGLALGSACLVVRTRKGPGKGATRLFVFPVAILGGCHCAGGLVDSDGPGSTWPPDASSAVLFMGRAGGRAGLGLSTGDLDGDGVPEVLVAELNDASSCAEGEDCASGWLLSAPFEGGELREVSTARFTASAEALAEGSYPLHRDMAFVGDLSGDGQDDILLWADRWADTDPAFDPDGQVFLLWSGPFEGEIAREQAVAMVDPMPGVLDHAPCDVDEDGQPDLCTNGGLLRGPLRGQIYAHQFECHFRNDGHPYEGGVSRYVEAGQIVEDGRPSMVISHSMQGWEDPASYELWILGGTEEPCELHRSAGYPNHSSDWDYWYWVSRQVVVDGDISGDGLEDILLLGELDGLRHLAIYDDPEELLITAPSITISSTRPASEGDGALLADFDGDGQRDLAWASAGGWVSIFRGPLSAGQYSELQADLRLIGADEPSCADNACSVPDGFGSAMAAGNLDGDDRADLLIGAPGAGDEEGRVYVAWGGGS